MMTTARANLFRALVMLAAAALAASLLMVVVGATTRTADAQTGAATQVLRDTWEWDGQAWTNLSEDLPSAPHVLPGLAMADNPAGGTTLLVGTGVDSGQFETWEFDGNSNTWSQAPETAGPAGGPSPRPSYAMALDQARNVVVLFGGGDAAVGGAAVDTWEWNATTKTWQAKAATGPPARTGHAMAWLPRSRWLLLFGGEGNTVKGQAKVNDTWTWDGTAWTLRTDTGSPSPRSGHAMALDQVRDVVVLFGGLPDSNQANVEPGAGMELHGTR